MAEPITPTVGETRPNRGTRWGVLSALWVLGLALLPIYLAPSGRPQVSHFVLAATAVIAYLGIGFGVLPSLRPASRSLALFVAYAVAVDVTWMLVTGDSRFLLAAIFYVFDYFVFRTFLVMFSNYGQPFLRLTVKTSIGALVVLALATAATGQTGAFRSTGFFNNPNQLAYYTVLTATVAALGSRQLRLDVRWQVAFYTSALYLSTVANSKAGYAALAALLLIAAIRRPAVAVLVGMIAVIAIQLSPVASRQVGNSATRVTTLQSDDSLAERGYGLLVEYPEYLAIGAGEGDFRRFGLPHEIHSTWATIVFAYGLPGTLLFAIFLLRLLGRTRPSIVVYLAPVALYGVAHQGLRFTMLWVVLAFVIASGQEEKRSAQGR